MAKADLPVADLEKITAILMRFDLPTTLPPGFSTSAILESMGRDKKFEAGQVRFVLTPRIGEAFLSTPGQIDRDHLAMVVEGLRSTAT